MYIAAQCNYNVLQIKYIIFRLKYHFSHYVDYEQLFRLTMSQSTTEGQILQGDIYSERHPERKLKLPFSLGHLKSKCISPYN